MGKSRNPNTYSDVAAVLDAAIAAGGEAIYETSHYAEATRWRARAYQLRLLLRDLAAETLPPGMAPTTRFDHLLLTIDKKEPTKVRISVRKPTGRLVTPEGKPIEVAGPRDVQRNPLQDDIDDLMKDLQ